MKAVYQKENSIGRISAIIKPKNDKGTKNWGDSGVTNADDQRMIEVIND